MFRLNGNNTTINGLSGAGTNDNAAAGAATLTVGSNDDTSTFDGLCRDGGSGNFGLIKTGAGTLTLSGTNTYSGGTTVNAGMLQIGGSGQLGGGTYSGAISNSSQFYYNSAADQTLSGVISGTGAVIKANSGTLTLSGQNTYSGPTIVSSGTLGTGAELALTANTTLEVFSGGNIDLGGTTQTVDRLYFDTFLQIAGSYGGAGSGAMFVYTNYFTGSGILNVIHGIPQGTVIMMY